MSSSRIRDDAPLTGADCFLRAFDDEVRRFHGASHLSQLVLRLGPGFDVERFQRLIDDVARATPMLRAPVRRRLGIGALMYRLAAASTAPLPTVTVDDAPLRAWNETTPPPSFTTRLNGRLAIERGELVRFDVVRYGERAERSDLAITWAHLLFDGVGSELFVRTLDDCFHGRRALGDLAADDVVDPTAPRGRLRERGARARKWQAQTIAYGASPPRSLGGPRRQVPQDLAYEVLTLSLAETALVTRRAAAVAGYLTPVLFYLAATIRAHDAVFGARGADPGHYLVPLPVNLRPKGRDVVFRTNVSLLWFHVARRDVADLGALVAELMRQRRAAIRDGMIEGAVAAMDFARFLPARLQSWIARANFGGELASFYFAFTNEFLPGMRTFCGAEISNGFHAPSVMPSPGTSVIMSIRDGRLNVTLIWQRGVLSADERLCLRDQLLDDLLGRGGSAESLRSSG